MLGTTNKVGHMLGGIKNALGAGRLPIFDIVSQGDGHDVDTPLSTPGRPVTPDSPVTPLWAFLPVFPAFPVFPLFPLFPLPFMAIPYDKKNRPIRSSVDNDDKINR